MEIGLTGLVVSRRDRNEYRDLRCRSARFELFSFVNPRRNPPGGTPRLSAALQDSRCQIPLQWHFSPAIASLETGGSLGSWSLGRSVGSRRR